MAWKFTVIKFYGEIVHIESWQILILLKSCFTLDVMAMFRVPSVYGFWFYGSATNRKTIRLNSM